MKTNLRVLALFGAVLLLAACGEGVVLDAVDVEEVGVEAPDEGTGVLEYQVDPLPSPCAVDEACDEPLVAELLIPGEQPDPTGDAGTPAVVDAGAVTPPSPWRAGAKVIVRGYVTFRSAPSSTASLVTTIAPRGGVTDSEHAGGMPRGQLTPGQVATLVDGVKTNGFYKLSFDGKTGWSAGSWLEPIDTSVHKTAFALRPRVWNAFFKHQLHRSRYNKDGPLSSGTCAPTSLAMAARVFGKEPAGLSVEQAIHRARQSYGVTTDHVGTTRAQITAGARALGLSVNVLSTRLSASSMLTRLANQLAAKRVVVLEGQPGVTGPATAYQQAFNRAYAAAGLTKTYTFDGRHSILVMGRDAGGKYVVADPLSEVGVITLTGAELKDFFVRWGGTGNAVWVP